MLGRLTIKKAVTRFVPRSLLEFYRKVRILVIRRRNRRKSARDVFTEIYQNNKWGGRPGEYCSGSGSSEQHASAYAEVIKRFISEKKVWKVVDFGCGDFTVGSKLQVDGVKYIGVDIVDDLIRQNQSRYASKCVSFVCLDILADEMPDGDLCLIRQVLQHLSNAQILSVLRQIRKYPYVIITEHYPAPSRKCVSNRDKPHGLDTRIYDDSAVYLDSPPFDLKNLQLILEVDAEVPAMYPGEQLRTYLITNASVTP